MRIVEVCTGYPPDRTGGAEQVVSTIRDGLMPLGNEVLVVTRFWGTHVFSPGVAQIRTPRTESGGYLSWASQATRLVRKLRPDVIHCHGLEGAIVCILTKGRGLRRVMHVHNSLSRERGHLSSISHWIGLFILELGIAMADVILVPTEVVKKDVQTHIPWINHNRIKVVPNPVARFKPASDEEVTELRKRYVLGERKIILYFGKIKRSKGLEEICKAYLGMKRKNEVALVVAGAPTATDRFYSQLKRTYKDVVFTGPVPDPGPFYQVADMFCIYTTGFEGGETFAIALAEAMYSLVPVVCADNPIFREVTGGNALFVDPKNPEALSETFDQALEHLPSLESMAEGAFKIASSNYAPEVFTRRILSIYELMRRPSGGQWA